MSSTLQDDPIMPNKPSRLRTISFVAALLGLLFVSISCKPPRAKSEYWDDLVAFMRRVEPLVKYDPYTARVYFDEATIQRDWQQTIAMMRSKGCAPYPIKWGTNNYDKAKGYFSRPIQFENDAWERDLFNQIQTGRGWGIVQTKYPKAGLQHGDYEVPCVLKFYITWCAEDTYGRGCYYTMTIKSQRSSQGTPPATQTSSDTAVSPSADPAEKLKRLKEMLDSGLITKEEYDQKRKAILDQL